MKIPVREYAQKRGCSASTVYQASRSRKFKIVDGQLDPAAADKAWPEGSAASTEARPRMANRVISWIQRRGVSLTARDLGIKPRAVFSYIQGTISPRPDKASRMVELAAGEGCAFRLEEFYTPTTKKEPK